MILYRDSIADIYCRLSVTNILYFYLVQVFFVLDNTLILLFIILLDSVDVTAVLAIFMVRQDMLTFGEQVISSPFCNGSTNI